MSHYIEFTTSPEHPFIKYSLGNPVHDGGRPTPFREVRGVRIDGQPILFREPDIVDALAQTIVDGEALPAQGIPFNCISFTALMHSVELELPPAYNPFLTIDGKTAISPSSTSQTDPLCLGVMTKASEVRQLHFVSPAHFNQEANYLHKLGNDGPICMSGLYAAMRMYNANFVGRAVSTST